MNSGGQGSSHPPLSVGLNSFYATMVNANPHSHPQTFQDCPPLLPPPPNFQNPWNSGPVSGPGHFHTPHPHPPWTQADIKLNIPNPSLAHASSAGHASSSSSSAHHNNNVHHGGHSGSSSTSKSPSNSLLHPCQMCGKSYKKADSLKKHISTEHKEKTFPCGVCLKTFRFDYRLKNHMRTHLEGGSGRKEEERTFKCQVCGKGFFRNDHLKKHLISIHSEGDLFLCPICGKGFSQKYNMKKHVTIHSNTEPFSCNYCGKKFLFNYKLKKHLSVHTGESPYKCDICKKTFRSEKQRKEHQKMHPPSRPMLPVEILKCIGCSKQFNSPGSLSRHAKECPANLIIFPPLHPVSNPAHSHHPSSHHHLNAPAPPKPVVNHMQSWNCPTCFKSFDFHTQLKKHLKIHDEARREAERKYSCEHCEKSFLRSDHLKKHELSIHQIGETIECPLIDCKKKFVHQYNLKLHLMVHSNQEPFTCEFCSKKFLFNYKLKRHVNSVHASESLAQITQQNQMQHLPLRQANSLGRGGAPNSSKQMYVGKAS